MKQDPNLFDAFLRVDNKRTSAQAPAKAKVKGAGLSLPEVEQKWVLGGGATVLILLIFLGGFFFGRITDGEAQAKGPATVEKPLERGTPSLGLRGSKGGQGAPVRGSQSTGAATNPGSGDYSPVSESRGLYKSTNRFTVLAITYTDQPSLESRAKEIAEYLRAQGFPAFDPVGRDGSIEILVGATPTRGELSAILSRLRVTKGPNGRSYDFETAYIDNIDNHTDR
ncbi:MAG: hypothetical protein P8N31_04725 [Planctomycetota bacterium]|nr:hypothetical protein [Planctomycetota bacterium]MDG2142840.1 hypothetical protein [Planctomycetota bacterium]